MTLIVQNYPTPTQTRRVNGFTGAVWLAGKLIEDSVCFYLEPEPNDVYRFVFNDDAAVTASVDAYVVQLPDPSLERLKRDVARYDLEEIDEPDGDANKARPPDGDDYNELYQMVMSA